MENNSAAGEGGAGEGQLLVLKSVLDHDKVIKYQDEDGKPH